MERLRFCNIPRLCTTHLKNLRFPHKYIKYYRKKTPQHKICRVGMKANAIQTESRLPWKIEPDYFPLLPLHQIGAARVRRVPVSNRQEDSLGVPGGPQAFRRQQPVAGAVPATCSVHVTWPIAHVEVEASI